MSIPFRNVFVPKRGLTRVPYSSTTRPAAGHSNRPRIAPSPTPGVLSPGVGLVGLEELSDHPVVVSSLVSHPRQERPPLGRLAVGLGPFALRLGPEDRHFPAAGLQPAPPVRQTLGSYTILLNHPGVHRRQRGQVAEAHGLGDGVVAREKDRQRSALDLQPVYRAQALGHGVLLPPPSILEAGDVVLEIAHLGLGTLDPPVEQRHLPALVVQAPVDRLELGEDAGLALARLGSLGALLLEALLRLLERALLLVEVRAVFLLLAGRR